MFCIFKSVGWNKERLGEKEKRSYYDKWSGKLVYLKKKGYNLINE